MRRARSGDADAFAALYETHRAGVLATCLNRLRDRDLADDAVQDTFLRAYACLDRFDEHRPMGPWLNSIAVRRCIDLLRRSRRIESSDEVEEHLPPQVEADPTLGAVIAMEERGRLQRALRRLHPRQRRALLLYALEGWSYADIAAAEGISVASAKSLLFHARTNLRRACRRGVLTTLAAALLAVRRRATRGAMTIRSRLAAGLEPIASSVAPVSSSVAAVFLSLTAATAPTITMASASLAAGTPATVTAPGAGSAARHIRGVAPRTQLQGLAGSLLNPTKDATPEKTQFTSVAPSPNYQEDRTLLAAGRVSCPQTWCSVLFVSRDGGASWVRKATSDFQGHTVLLPPSYPNDPRVFAMGPSGLQVSNDGGTTFDVVLPVQGDTAISPSFDGEDQRLLIGATIVTEYWADSNLAKPATLIGPAGTWLTVAFSPAYAQDHTIFVGGIRPDASGVMRPTVNRCADSVCDSLVFEHGFDAPWIRPSPKFASDRTVWAFTMHALFRSTDGGSTFTSFEPDFASPDLIRDVSVAPDGSLLVAVSGTNRGDGGLFQSFDGGATWVRRNVSLAGFEIGVARLAALPDGHLLALGVERGIACSGDSGRTWRSRCRFVRFGLVTDPRT